MRRCGLFVPLLFLTTTFAPLQAMADWPRIAAILNPVAYILDGCGRSPSPDGNSTGSPPHCSPPEPSARPHSGLA